MTAATVLAPLANLRAPLIAGAAAALLMVLAVIATAIFGRADFSAPFARGEVAPGEIPVAEAAAGAPVQFAGETEGEEPSLPGVAEGFREPEAPAASTRRAAVNPNALPAAPIAGLTEPGPGGPLPVISAGGQRVSDAYARPFSGDAASPTIAVVIGGLGLNRAVTEAAIDDLPPEIALSFAPYADDLQDWIDRARAAGHEVLIEAPMEPYDYPNNDPGPHTLLADGPPAENARRLMWVMSRATGYFGVTNYLGARFSASGGAMEDMMATLESRGVAFLHDGAGRRSTIEAAGEAAGAQFAIADRVLDEDPSPRAIDDRLLALEALALQEGASIGSGFAYPATVDQVRDWAVTLRARGYQLAPPSAVIARRQLEAREMEAAAAATEQAGEPN
jgi:polysaccharide deacetylase 2 family uncharacterized protein YibQ